MEETNVRGSQAEFFGGYTYEDMNKYGFIFSPYSESHPNNLKGDIHPIFRPSNWDSQEFYNVMIPVFRLASNILRAPNSRVFIYNVFYAERKLLVELSNQLGREARQFNQIKAVPFSRVLTHTNDLLDGLSDFIEFRWFDPSNPGISPHQVAYCGKNPRDLAWMSDSRNPTGHASRISLNLAMVRTLTRLRNSPGHSGNSSQILRLQFTMANSLCHELVHACNNSITLGMGIAEPFFEDDRIAELGHAWDSAVFGGTWYPIGDFIATYPLLVVKWASFERRATPVSLERSAPHKYQSKYFIHMDWIARIQQDSQWQSENLQHYTTLLRIPKTFGFREKYPHGDFDPDWKSQNSSNMKYPMDAAGRVFRDPPPPQNSERAEQSSSSTGSSYGVIT